MPTPRLSDAEISERLRALPTWTVLAGKLHREYRFADFVSAFGFMSSVALVAESMDHHPEWSNVYRDVRVDLVTHDAGGISAKDFVLATRIEALAARAGAG